MRIDLCNSEKVHIKGLFLCFLLFNIHLLSIGQNKGFVDTLFVKRLNNLNLEIKIPYNDIAGDNITLLTHQKIKYTSQSLGSFFVERDYIVSVIKSAHLPEELQYLPLALTQMNTTFQDKFHCAGIWQLPYFVAVNCGLTLNDEIDERYDVKKSTVAAVAYLKKLSEKYTDFWDLIIAYANGSSALETAKIRSNHKEDVWSLYTFGNLPHKDIIPDFITYLYLANFYHSHHIKPVAPKTDGEFTAIYLQKSVSRDKFISTLQLDKSRFSNSNPVLRGKNLPAHYQIQIPSEKSTLFLLLEDSLYVVDTVEYNTAENIVAASSKPSVPPPSQTKPTYYTVKSGDVLSKLAVKYNTNVSQLKKWNNLKNDNIYVGQRLIVRQRTSPPKTEINTPPTPKPSDNNRTSTNKDENKKTTLYTIKSGDTLNKIAKMYNVSIEDIKKWNNLKSDTIYAGQQLIIR
ncbi:MAG: LysM peptidoglycan-binding domain-containing protein [Bacteroidales bacterium]|jgi:membrane-bound lytic murein transglycosylase D|nr:LysM peptidoglycan-binding domain-containing protein [Bacteroidales bacterium]